LWYTIENVPLNRSRYWSKKVPLPDCKPDDFDSALEFLPLASNFTTLIFLINVEKVDVIYTPGFNRYLI